MSKENDCTDKVACFLQKYDKDIYLSWKNKLVFPPDESQKEVITANSRTMYDLIVLCLTNPDSDYTEQIKDLSMKVASEKVKAGIHIKYTVSNILTTQKETIMHIQREFTDSPSVSHSINIIRNMYEQVVYYTVAYFTDLQNEIIQKQNEVLSETHKERLTMLGQMTSSFVHEFRNPLTSIKGFVQLLKAEHPHLKYLDIIQIELEQLNSRISDFLALSKKDTPEKKPSIFSLHQLIDEVIGFLYPSIVDTNVHVESFINKGIYLFGQLEEIRQVLLNIIFNALDVLTNTPDPKITITSAENETETLQLMIANNGPQIEEDMLEEIFKPFITSKSIGTGLGLFVCKQIIERHEGTLTCISSKAQTTFIITLPMVADAG
ncbi:MAG: ATP-binding protein [Bacillus sp. (in: firmicutes)]